MIFFLKPANETMRIINLTLATFAACTTSQIACGAIFWDSPVIPSNPPGTPGMALANVTSAHFAMVGHADAPVTGQYPVGGAGTAPDVAKTGLNFLGMYVNGTLTPIAMDIQEIGGITPHGGAGSGLNNARISTYLQDPIPDGAEIEWRWSYDTPLTSASPAGPDLMGFGNTPASTATSTIFGSEANLRAAMLIDQGVSNPFGIFNASGGAIGSTTLTVGGYNISSIGGTTFDDDFDVPDPVAFDGVDTFTFQQDQLFDGVFPGDGTWTQGIIDATNAGAGVEATPPDLAFSTLSWRMQLNPGAGNLNAGTQFTFTFDGVPIPEPSRALLLLGFAAPMMLLRRRR